MIKIIFKTHQDKIAGFYISGHAQFAEYGQDIVCAAVSVLSINTVNSIQEFTDTHFTCETSEKDGIINFLLSDMQDDKSQLLLRAMKLGLESIRKQYTNKYIEIIFEEV